jgi:sugar/nucleoside kinase (ribokinase family)
MSNVIVAGVVNVRAARRCDVFPIPFVPGTFDPGGISIRLSGTGWTAARTIGRLGGNVVFATYVGADELGGFVASGLRRCGLYGPTTLVCASQPRAMVIYDRDGRRANATDLRTTPDLRYPVRVLESALPDDIAWDAAVLTNIGFTRTLIPFAVDRGIPIATDLQLVDDVASPHNRDWMRAAHILACSHEQLPDTPEQWINAMWRTYGTSLVLVGCGARGALLGVRATRRIWQVRPATPRGLRYTSGAGDTLLASFVHQQFASGDPVASARHAVLAAGWKIGGEPEDEPGIDGAVLDDLRSTHGLPEVIRL